MSLFLNSYSLTLPALDSSAGLMLVRWSEWKSVPSPVAVLATETVTKSTWKIVEAFIDKAGIRPAFTQGA